MKSVTAPRIYPAKYERFAQLDVVKSVEFRTHDFVGELLHALSEKALEPFHNFICCKALVQHQINPGKVEKKGCWMRIKKVGALLGCIASFPPTLLSLPLGMGLRALDHGRRPLMSYLYTPTTPGKDRLFLTPENPLTVATWNVALTPTSVGIEMNLRPAVDRALEMVKMIAAHPPDVLVIQEGWNEDALKVLCTGLAATYRHIIHSIAPSLMGMSSGIAVFSKYEIKKVSFTLLENMVWPHSLPPRGVVRLVLDEGVTIYGGIHTQSMDGFKYVQARVAQIQQIKKLVGDDPRAIIMGDFNTSTVDMFGRDTSDQAEALAYNTLQSAFHDLYLEDHDPLTGLRTRGKPLFTDQKEPCASWNDPFDTPDLQKPWLEATEDDRRKHGYPPPKFISGKGLPPTPRWSTGIPWARNARYDYTLVSKNSDLEGCSQMLQLGDVSDHLPVYAHVWLKDTEERKGK